MRKIQLGRTGMVVNELGLGGIPLTRVEPDAAVELIRHCADQGIDFYDTANMYGDSEEKMGRALEPVRDKVFLATKTMAHTKDQAREHMDLSLKRLRTDHIDLIQLHNMTDQARIDAMLGKDGAMEALEEYKKQGKVRHIGFSSHNPDVAARLCRTGLFETVQIPFNFVESDPVERLFGTALEMNMGILAMKPLGGGNLNRADLCFKFLQGHPEALPIPGIETLAEIDEILELYRNPTKATPENLAEMGRIKKELGDKFCHRCEYCLPCPEGVPIPMALLFDSQAKRYPKEMVLKLTAKTMEAAENCTGCGQCLEKCPYDLPVPDLIAGVLERYHAFCNKAD